MSPLLTCAAVRPHLHAFADGELRGDVLRGVTTHLEGCESCADRVLEIGEIGQLVRSGAPVDHEPQDLAGLADGVVSRIRAEDHESWRGVFERATDDLHWVMVGVGSVAASFVSALIVAFVVQSGMEQRADSLAALLNSLAATPTEISRTPTAAEFAALGIDNVQLASLADANDYVRSLRLLKNLDERDVRILVPELSRAKFEVPRNHRTAGPGVVLAFSKTEVRGL